MEKITIAVLTVSDRCSKGYATDESGPHVIQLIRNGIIKNGELVLSGLVPDKQVDIKKTIVNWCDKKNVAVILTVGGTGVAPRDVTPEATSAVLDKKIPGISYMIFKQSSEITPLASLSRGLSGVRGQTLIINLPGSKKGAEECLVSVSNIIPHAVDLIRNRKENIEKTHASLNKKKSKVSVISEKDRKRKSPYPCLKVAEAQEMIFGKIEAFRRIITLDYQNALGYVLGEDVKAIDDLPPFDASIKDGYAIISTDQTRLKILTGSCPAGALPTCMVIKGTCMSVNTGAPVPSGADTIVPVEDTYFHKDGNDTEIEIIEFPPSGENIRPKGFDFKAGSLLMPTGTFLGSSAIGLLAAAGVLSVQVFDKPDVAVMSTGDEIVDPDKTLKPGKVRDSNRVTIISMLKEEKFHAHDLGIVKDDPDSLYTALVHGFEISDVVISTGSMSMGDKDYLKDVLQTDFGADILFGAVFMKPGKPTAFATLTFKGQPKMWFGLPGNPASAVVTTYLFLLPALRFVSGNSNKFPSRVEATLTFDITLLDRPHFHRGILSYVEGKFTISTTGNQSSSRVGSCAEANCLIEIPDGKGTVPRGTTVTALLIGNHF